MYKGLVPIAFPNPRAILSPVPVLAADVGGTKTHLTLFEVDNERIHLVREATYASQDYPSFGTIIKDFKKGGSLPERLSIGFAGPVVEGKARATNLNWMIDAEILSKELDIPDIFLLNDLESNAYGLAALTAEDFDTLDRGDQHGGGNAAIIAPGTGLGEAGLFWDGTQYHPFATEGGHTDFGPRKGIDIDLFNYLTKKYGHVSWERLVSGMGIYEIYIFLLKYRKVKEKSWMRDKINEGDASAAISYGAKNGCAICRETFVMFWRYLAEESANLVLKLKAIGGLYIGGGIAPKNLDHFNRELFMNFFHEAGRLRPLLEEIPVHIILNEKTALYGAALYGVFGEVSTNINTKSFSS